MKKLFALLAACSALAGAAQATVLDFDYPADSGELTPLSDTSPYPALEWSASWYLGDVSVPGYSNAAHSGAGFVLNGYGANDQRISGGQAFSFIGAWFAVPQINGSKASWINITAYDASGALIGSTGNVSISSTYSWVEADFSNVSRLVISRDKGWYVMDDFSFAATVPEPGMPLMMAAGLALLAVAGRRKHTQSLGR